MPSVSLAASFWAFNDGDASAIKVAVEEVKPAFTKSATDFNDPLTNTHQADGAAYCALKPWCTAATSPPACNPNHVYERPRIFGITVNCYPYYTSRWLAVKYAGSSVWDCYPVIPGENATGTTDSSLGSCSKQ